MANPFASLRLCAFALTLILLACATPQRTDRAPFHPQKLAQIDAAIASAISSSKLPGGVLWLEHNGAQYHKAYGQRSVDPVETMTEDTVFDAASLTNVIATTSAIMLLQQRGQIEIDAPVSKYLSEFNSPSQQPVTIRHLMTHTSGLRPGIPATPAWRGYEKGIQLATAEQPTTKPGAAHRYSDVNYILLGEVAHRVSGKPLNEFVEREVFKPLGMRNSYFLPKNPQLTAPTTKETNGFIRGIVHDPTSRRMGGVAGHAGLFTTASDLAIFARMMLNEGKPVFKKETVALMTSVQSPTNVVRRGLGWDIDSAYAGPRGRHFPVGSYGHTGWTGTSIWIDPFSKSFVIFMSNRNHPTEAGSVLALRSLLGTLTAEAIPDFNFLYVPEALERRPERERTLITRPVLNGIDVLKRDRYSKLKGMRLGLITNHTGQDRDRNATIDLLHKAEGVQLKALFSPEHGIRGALDQNEIKDSIDEQTGLPVYSLYDGQRRSPKPENLKDIDALVFDIQDIGCRFYTYISTMGNCLEAAAKANLKIFVLDRVNPIGSATEGPITDGKSTFVAYHNIPVRHGMTVGELARMFNVERGFNANLTIIPIENWSRDFFYDQTELPWTNPSPNMRSLTEAILYPGIGLLETTAVSVGRGTDTPFEVVAAPYIDDRQLARELNAANLPGVRFVPVQFTPNASVFKGQKCKGVNIILTDRTAPVIDIGITIALTLQRLYPNDWNVPKFVTLLAHQKTLDAVREQKSLAQIKSLWTADLADFNFRRSKYVLY